MSRLSRISASIALGIILAISLFNNYWVDNSYQSGCFLKHSTDWINAICYDRRDPNDFSTYEANKQKAVVNWVPTHLFGCGSEVHEQRKKIDPYEPC